MRVGDIYGIQKLWVRKVTGHALRYGRSAITQQLDRSQVKHAGRSAGKIRGASDPQEDDLRHLCHSPSEKRSDTLMTVVPVSGGRNVSVSKAPLRQSVNSWPRILVRSCWMVG